MKKATPALLQAALQNKLGGPSEKPEPKKNSLLLSSTPALIPNTMGVAGVANNGAVDRARSTGGGGMMGGPLTATLAPAVGMGGQPVANALSDASMGALGTPAPVAPVAPAPQPQAHPMPPAELLKGVQWDDKFAPLLGEARAAAQRGDPNAQATVHALEGALNVHNAKLTMNQSEGVMLPGGVVLPRGLTDRETAPKYAEDGLRKRSEALQAKGTQATADHKVALAEAKVPSHMTRRKQNIAMGILLIAAAFGADPRYMNEVTHQWVQSIQEMDDKDLADLKEKMQADYEKLQAGLAIEQSDIENIFRKVQEVGKGYQQEADQRATITAAQIAKGMEMDDAAHAAEMKRAAEEQKQQGRIDLVNAKDITPSERIARLVEAGYSPEWAREAVAAADNAKLAQTEGTKARTEGTKLSNKEKTLRLKWLEPKLKADLDRTMALIAKSKQSGGSGSGEAKTSFAQSRLMVSEQMKELRRERANAQSLMGATPGGAAVYGEKIKEIDGKIDELRKWMDEATAGVLGKTPAPNSGAVTPAAGAGVSAGVSAGKATVGKSIVKLGVPYKWGGTDKDGGIDCSGLTQCIYKENGVEIPRTAIQQWRSPKLATAPKGDMKPGDLVFFESTANRTADRYAKDAGGYVTHVAIVGNDGRIVQAVKGGTKTESLEAYLKRSGSKLLGIKRLAS